MDAVAGTTVAPRLMKSTVILTHALGDEDLAHTVKRGIAHEGPCRPTEKTGVIIPTQTNCQHGKAGPGVSQNSFST